MPGSMLRKGTLTMSKTDLDSALSCSQESSGKDRQNNTWKPWARGKYGGEAEGTKNRVIQSVGSKRELLDYQSVP